MTYKGKVSLITGGSSGIGLSTAKELARLGSHVWLVARNYDNLANAIRQLEENRLSPDQCFGFSTADVSRPEEARQAVARASREVGVPDLVINSAGVVHPGYIQDLEIDVFQWMMETNYLGSVYITKAVLPGMIVRRSGHIVYLSSLAGIVGLFGYTAYSGSKFAIRGFSDALRSELKHLGIRVSIVFPPDTDTPQLAYENQYKPPETKYLTGQVSLADPDQVAGEILKGVARGKYIIAPGKEAKLIFWLSGLLGTRTYTVIDWLVGRAVKQAGRQS